MAGPGSEREERLLLSVVESGEKIGELADDLRHALQVAIGLGEVELECFLEVFLGVWSGEPGDDEFEGIAHFRTGQAGGPDDGADDAFEVHEFEAALLGDAADAGDALEHVIDGDVVIVGDGVEGVENPGEVPDVETEGGVDGGEFFRSFGGCDFRDVGGD